MTDRPRNGICNAHGLGLSCTSVGQRTKENIKGPLVQSNVIHFLQVRKVVPDHFAWLMILIKARTDQPRLIVTIHSIAKWYTNGQCYHKLNREPAANWPNSGSSCYHRLNRELIPIRQLLSLTRSRTIQSWSLYSNRLNRGFYLSWENFERVSRMLSLGLEGDKRAKAKGTERRITNSP